MKIIHDVGLAQAGLAGEAFKITLGIEAINVVSRAGHSLCNIDGKSAPSSVSGGEYYRAPKSALSRVEIDILRLTSNPHGVPSWYMSRGLSGPRKNEQTGKHKG